MEVSEIVLKVLSGVHVGAEMALHKGRSYSIGKDTNCDVILADSVLHPLHGEILVEDSSVLLTQKEGRVLLDGELQIEKQLPIQPFQVITLGTTHIAVGPKEGKWKSISLPSLDHSLKYGSELPPEEYQEEEPKRSKWPLGAAAGVVGGVILVAVLYFIFASGEEEEEKGVAIQISQSMKEVTSILNSEQYSSLKAAPRGKKIFITGYLEQAEQMEILKEELGELPTILQIKTQDDIIASIQNSFSNFSFADRLTIESLGGKTFKIVGTVTGSQDLEKIDETLSRVVGAGARILNEVEVKIPIPDVVIKVKSVRTGPDSYIVLEDGKKYREGDRVLQDFVLKKVFLDKLLMEYKNNEFVYTFSAQ